LPTFAPLAPSASALAAVPNRQRKTLGKPVSRPSSRHPRARCVAREAPPAAGERAARLVQYSRRIQRDQVWISSSRIKGPGRPKIGAKLGCTSRVEPDKDYEKLIREMRLEQQRYKDIDAALKAQPCPDDVWLH
jgi:hypothetical protein